ncbi:lytic murein transglycosylase [Pseudomonas sp. F1_0610]|uniref:lytic murein transglycosylase n=1 Tax=Pseudomonas sp. F1_0610 TaxID=3114284 RepID=UPI0039C44120
MFFLRHFCSSFFIFVNCILLSLASQADTVDPQLYIQKHAQAFHIWVSDFKKQALSKGIPQTTLDAAFKDITLDPQVIRLDNTQPEFSRPVWEYLAGATAQGQVNIGKKNLNEQQAVLTKIAQSYQVDPEIIVAIWGMESGYGANTGKSNVFRSLATLAYEGRRANFWKQELMAALSIVQAGDRKVTDLTGSWAGAMGQTQFMPSTFLRFAVDFDGDGKRNIWTSKADALASTANYLKHYGWKYQIPWGMEVKLPANFNYQLADGIQQKTVAQWKALGVRGFITIDSKLDQEIATLFVPAGHKGAAFLLLDNFRVIMRYNNSTAYALAISLLADQFKGKANVQSSWPTEDRPLSRSERVEMQEILNGLGYNAGSTDGIIGINTRQAIQAFQIDYSLIPDSYASITLLDALRAATKAAITQ